MILISDKIQWAIEGDGNSKYFHGIINKKRSQLAIRGVLVDGEWIEDPPKVKNEFLEHFSNRFSMPTGPDGLSFEFIRKYWNIIQHDVVNAVKEFFSSSKFPPKSNSSFITLISDVQTAIISKGWIQACLSSAMGSILVNGSPSSEFKFHKGIRIDESLTLSHLFYADDVVFIGKWDKANVITIVNMLKCFYLASGLKINIQKSKIMGIGTSQEEVDVAANVIGCNMFSSPFNYLGVKVGSSSSRSNF
ncbi:RNA-directed DNA polymerase, eukaryota [Tanacetum coccineum]